MGEACSMQGVRRVSYIFLVGKDDGKRPLGKPWSIQEDSIKWVLKKSFGMVWIAFIWLETRARRKKFQFGKSQEFSWPDDELDSKENSVPWNKLTCELSTLIVGDY